MLGGFLVLIYMSAPPKTLPTLPNTPRCQCLRIEGVFPPRSAMRNVPGGSWNLKDPIQERSQFHVDLWMSRDITLAPGLRTPGSRLLRPEDVPRTWTEAALASTCAEIGASWNILEFHLSRLIWPSHCSGRAAVALGSLAPLNLVRGVQRRRGVRVGSSGSNAMIF